MQVAGKAKRQVFNEINITPLTDIFLVLLIIMMVVAPMMQQLNSEIKPPTVTGGSPVEQTRFTVEVTRQGQFFVEGTPVAAEQLVAILQEKGKTMDEKNVVVRADQATRSGAVLKVFEAARDAGFEKVTVAGESLGKDRQQELGRQAASQGMTPPPQGFEEGLR